MSKVPSDGIFLSEARCIGLFVVDERMWAIYRATLGRNPSMEAIQMHAETGGVVRVAVGMAELAYVSPFVTYRLRLRRCGLGQETGGPMWYSHVLPPVPIQKANTTSTTQEAIDGLREVTYFWALNANRRLKHMPLWKLFPNTAFQESTGLQTAEFPVFQTHDDAIVNIKQAAELYSSDETATGAGIAYLETYRASSAVVVAHNRCRTLLAEHQAAALAQLDDAAITRLAAWLDENTTATLIPGSTSLSPAFQHLCAQLFDVSDKQRRRDGRHGGEQMDVALTTLLVNVVDKSPCGMHLLADGILASLYSDFPPWACAVRVEWSLRTLGAFLGRTAVESTVVRDKCAYAHRGSTILWLNQHRKEALKQVMQWTEYQSVFVQGGRWPPISVVDIPIEATLRSYRGGSLYSLEDVIAQIVPRDFRFRNMVCNHPCNFTVVAPNVFVRRLGFGKLPLLVGTTDIREYVVNPSDARRRFANDSSTSLFVVVLAAEHFTMEELGELFVTIYRARTTQAPAVRLENVLVYGHACSARGFPLRLLLQCATTHLADFAASNAVTVGAAVTRFGAQLMALGRLRAVASKDDLDADVKPLISHATSKRFWTSEQYKASRRRLDGTPPTLVHTTDLATMTETRQVLVVRARELFGWFPCDEILAVLLWLRAADTESQLIVLFEGHTDELGAPGNGDLAAQLGTCFTQRERRNLTLSWLPKTHMDLI